MVQQFTRRHHAVAMMCKIADQAIFEGCQRQWHTAQAHAHAARIDGDRANFYDRRAVTDGATDKRPYPCQELFELKWLGKIVVCTGIDAFDTLRPAATRRQDKHRHMAAVAAPLFENGDTIHARQAEVEHDEAVIFGIALEPGTFAVMDEFHGDKSLGIGSFSELLSKAKIVDDGDDVLFTFGNGKTLTLEYVDMKSLKAEHFDFKAGSEPLPTPEDEKLIGTASNDTLDGGGGNDTIYGHGGHDELDGGAGNDALYGGSGNDDLEGGAGHDRLDGRSGRNELEGGSGADTFVFSAGITEIEDFRAGTDKVELSKFLGVSNFSDMMTFATAINGGEDVRIDFGNAVLIFEDTTLTELKSSDFFFV